MKTAASALSLLVCCMAAAARAAEPVPAGLLACEKIPDVTERAHCYDAQLAAMKAAQNAQPAPPQSAPARDPAPASRPAQVPAAAASAPNRSQAVRFGAEQLPPANQPKPAPAETLLLSRIASIRDIGPKMWLITLANNQIWRQDGTGLTANFRQGDEARIEKGTLGDYRLSVDRVGAKNWVRVTRVH